MSSWIVVLSLFVITSLFALLPMWTGELWTAIIPVFLIGILIGIAEHSVFIGIGMVIGLIVFFIVIVSSNSKQSSRTSISSRVNNYNIGNDWEEIIDFSADDFNPDDFLQGE